LLVRYYNYARPYHEQLFQLWSSRLLREPFLYSYHPYEYEATGLIVDFAEEEVGDLTAHTYPEHNNISWGYSCGWFFSRSIIYFIYDENHSYDKKVNLFRNSKVGLVMYLKILWCELKHQTTSFVTHRENLDIYTPYFLGFAAILSYLFSSPLASLITELTNLTH
jgi:hypothetical protein